MSPVRTGSLLAVFMVALGACESTAAKCRRISVADAMATLERFVQPDSQPTGKVIPPRPSEVEWYKEHCWEGKPRP